MSLLSFVGFLISVSVGIEDALLSFTLLFMACMCAHISE
jgi:hypothetical protein